MASSARRICGYSRSQRKVTARLWEHDLQQLGVVANQIQAGNEKPYTPAFATAAANEPRATAANRASMTKALVETPILAGALPDVQRLASTTDDAAWGKIAELRQADAELDAASMAFIGAKNPNAGRAGALVGIKTGRRGSHAAIGANVSKHDRHRHRAKRLHLPATNP